MHTSHHIKQTNSHSDYSQWTYLMFLFVVLIYIIAHTDATYIEPNNKIQLTIQIIIFKYNNPTLQIYI